MLDGKKGLLKRINLFIRSFLLYFIVEVAL
jgi:hypothetical protein